MHFRFLPFAVFLIQLGACPFAANAQTEETSPVARFEKERTSLGEALAKEPDNIPLLSQRGDVNLFTARFREAVADYEKMIALDPSQDNPHWRLGIAYYLAGDFAKAARQFEKYQQHESGDRENGIWHFMSVARAKDIPSARKEMIAFTRFDREPFPALYDLFAGKITTDAFFADLKTRGLTENGSIMFFANYYAGVCEDLNGNKPRAAALLREAVKIGAQIPRSGGPGYMWQACRLQSDIANQPK
jgi:lipoprotein NlpI